MPNPLVDFIEKLKSRGPVYDWEPTVDEPPCFNRELVKCDPPIRAAQNRPTVEQARAIITKSILDYLAEPYPGRLLLIKVLPGVGKTTEAIRIIDQLIREGHRVAYAGPRHDFFQDVLDKVQDPSLWYEWLPRQQGEDKIETCRYTEQMASWLYRGYDAMDFCAGVCGWDYVNNTCPYHQQKSRTEPAIFIQHQHVSLGHPLQFNILFGDESPISAFLHEWKIPSKWIIPPGMENDDPLKELLSLMEAGANAFSVPLQGTDLIDYLGGPDMVLQATDGFSVSIDSLADVKIYRPEQAEEKPFFHLPALIGLLRREAKQYKAGIKYPYRIILAKNLLTLLLRRTPKKDRLPPHIIWLDATGRGDIYQQLFNMPVQVVDAQPHILGKVYQVVDRANGKTAMTSKTDEPPTRYAQQMEQLIVRVIENYQYKKPALIGFQKFTINTKLEGVDLGHFYAARGTNAFENADGLMVAGTPQANIFDMVKMAKMIWFGHDRAFNPAWSWKNCQYDYIAPDGLGRAYQVSGFWGDERLQILLEAIREDEITQAAHRCRPVNHVTDIWLFTNIPIAALPPDELITMREILGVPKGIQIFKGSKIAALMEQNDIIDFALVMETCGVVRATASAWVDIIAQEPGWGLIRLKSKHGRPMRAAYKLDAELTIEIKDRIIKC